MQLTIRKVEDSWVATAKAEAAKRGVSMNQVLLEALGIGLGIQGQRPRKRNMEQYAGDSDFGPEWETFLDDELNTIDPDQWN